MEPCDGGRIDPRERGSALIVALVTMFLLLMLTCTTTTEALFRQAGAAKSVDTDRAMVLAETALDRALYEMQVNRDYGTDGIGNASGIMSGGAYAATVSPAFAGPGDYTISASGTVHGVTRRITANVTEQVTRTGFVGKNWVTMSGGYVDSYSSNLGTYASQKNGTFAGSNGRLASNGNITLSGSATIHGDATPGPGMTVSGNTTLVSGSTAPASTPAPFAPFVYAPPISASGAFSGTKTFGTGVYRYTQFTVPGGGHVTFTGDVDLYVDGKFTISGSGYGTITSTGRLRIFQGSNDLTFSGGGVINQTQVPDRLQIFSASTTKVVDSGSAAFYGSIYAPNADGTVSGSAGAYGAFQAKSMTISGGANLHYDLALGNGSGHFTLSLVRPVAY
jgi:Tfp pilus assembly protein PilX